MKVTLFILYSILFALSFIFGTTFAQNVDVPLQYKSPESLNVRIARECQPSNAQCFVVPPTVLNELQEQFNALKKLITEKNQTIKELYEYKSKTCL